jgi:LynF/TruF/PatF family peptide O-prenyltransferase
MRISSPQLEKLHRHLAVFGVTETNLCEEFEALILASPEADLECSCKLCGDEVFPLRLNLWYRDASCFEGERKIWRFFDHIAYSGTLDNSFYHEVLGPNFQHQKVRYSVVGIDVRAEARESRAKIWHIIADYPELEARVLGLSGIGAAARQLKVHKGLLFGFDFTLTGKAALKVYPVWHDFQIRERTDFLRELVGGEAVALMAQCSRVSFAFTTLNETITLHMMPYDAERFIRELRAPHLLRAFRSIGVPEVILAMNLAEIKAGAGRSFGLYY